jgi:hypothetical protein
MLSYFDFKILIAAFLRVVPNKLGGILTTSCRVDIENNCAVLDGFEFMNLWVKIAIFIMYHEKISKRVSLIF